MEVPYTQKRVAQHRGPNTSDDYNTRIEENYQDLVLLYNRNRISEVEISELYRRMAKDQFAISNAISELESRVDTLESGNYRVTFYSGDQVDTDYWDPNTTIAVNESEKLTYDSRYGSLTLPKSEEASLSKLFFTDEDGSEVIPPGLVFNVLGDNSTADDGVNFVDTSDPEFALYRKPGLIWERNVITSAPDANGARVYVYVKVPTDLFATSKSNVIILHPFPLFGCTIEDVAYSVKIDPLLDNTDNYINLNAEGHYSGEDDAVGYIAPGGWDGVDDEADYIHKAGPKKFYFPSTDVTAVRVTLHQPDHYEEGAQYIYTYGLSRLDLGFDKFAPQGRALIKITANPGTSINEVTTVTPQIWNVPEGLIDDVFSYRIISGNNTSAQIGNDSLNNESEVWIEVTLKTTQNLVPTMTGLIVDYI